MQTEQIDQCQFVERFKTQVETWVFLFVEYCRIMSIFQTERKLTHERNNGAAAGAAES